MSPFLSQLAALEGQGESRGAEEIELLHGTLGTDETPRTTARIGCSNKFLYRGVGVGTLSTTAFRGEGTDDVSVSSG